MKKEKTIFDDQYKRERHRKLQLVAIYRLAIELQLYAEYYWDTENGLDDIVNLSLKEEKFSKEELKDITDMALKTFQMKENFFLTEKIPLRFERKL